MVDFNSEATVTTPSWELLKVLALEKRENLLLSVEFFFKNKLANEDVEHELNIIRARLWCLYYELEAWMLRNNQDVLSLRSQISSKSEVEVLAAVSAVNKFMDDKGLTKIDTKSVYNKMRTEEENERREL